MRADIIVPGLPDGEVGCAPAIVLTEPISFWGGVCASSGVLTDPRSRHHNRSISGAALFIRELRGSSSTSSVLLELIYRGRAPAAILLDAPDAILALGAIVAREMGWKSPPILRLSAAEQDGIADGASVSITRDGHLSVQGR
jgi:predicted aconitase with swiveling domain